MGTRWQGLKVEIGGDVESSYGSMSSCEFQDLQDGQSMLLCSIQWLQSR